MDFYPPNVGSLQHLPSDDLDDMSPDVKPDNFLRCRDGKLRLCDFDSARGVDDDEEGYEGMVTGEFLAPNRDYYRTGRPPTISDDIYALGLSIWPLYTGDKDLENEDMEEVLRDKRTVDVTHIFDPET
ncbi:hypothetical protein LTS18_007349 [Coniosporium uncinatum]|uniref:Uncharacterized protein n=1 Tax=Coniosporium uncinatum TaxID=93489 RepID=A0ACC3DPN3_9PEZI|nr:hypothetical protein LTS18_007349 [Coniosporium uncinatum]